MTDDLEIVFSGWHIYIHIQFSPVAQLCQTLCESMDCRTPGLPVHHQLPEFMQTHVHWVGVHTHTHTHTHTYMTDCLSPASVFLGSSVVKNLSPNAGDIGLIPGLERSPGEGNGEPFQYSCLGNAMDRGAWWITVHGVTKSQTQLSDWTTLSPASLQKLWPRMEDPQIKKTQRFLERFSHCLFGSICKHWVRKISYL